MANKIIEIVELGNPKSLIQRNNEPTTQLINTNILIDEINSQLRLNNNINCQCVAWCSGQSQLKKGYKCAKKFVNIT